MLINNKTLQNTASSYDVMATIKVADLNNIAVARKAMAALIPPTLDEPGCYYFYIAESVEEVGVFYLWESWKNKQALQDHYAAPHTVDYFSKEYTTVIAFKELVRLADEANE